MTETPAPSLPDGKPENRSRPPNAVDVGGTTFLPDASGDLTPLSNVKAADLLEDELVRKLIGFARPLSDQISRFKEHCFADILALDELLAQDYGAKLGGKKGNMTLLSYDGRLRVTVQVADEISFGPQLQQAKRLFDECLTEWSAEARDEIRALVSRAFNVDKQGLINKAELFRLLRLEIADERWQRAMQAIRDAIRIVGTKNYVRFHERDSHDGEWRPIVIDLARA